MVVCIFTMQVDLACPLGIVSPSDKTDADLRFHTLAYLSTVATLSDCDVL